MPMRGYAILSESVAVDEERFVAPVKNSWKRRESRKRNETLGACGSLKLGQVASGSATQGLWVGNGKTGS